MVRKLRVERKAFTTKKGTKVKKTSFLIKDRGRPGRGPKVIPMLKKGSLGGPGFFSKPMNVRRMFESALAKKIGEKSVVGKLRAIQNFNVRTNPIVSQKAASDANFIAGAFIGKKRVKSGTGFSRKRKRRSK